MIALPSGTHIWIAAGVTDLRRGFTGLSAAAQTVLEQDPYSGHVFVFRGRRGDLIKREPSVSVRSYGGRQERSGAYRLLLRPHARIFCQGLERTPSGKSSMVTGRPAKCGSSHFAMRV